MGKGTYGAAYGAVKGRPPKKKKKKKGKKNAY